MDSYFKGMFNLSRKTHLLSRAVKGAYSSQLYAKGGLLSEDFFKLASVNRYAHTARELNATLSDVDPEIESLIQKEQNRQRDSLVLIPSENFTSTAVQECLGSCMSNKYSEGYPGARYYGGNEIIDQVERLCQKRALDAFRLKPSEWAVNVQALSGSPANLYVYYALLKPHGRILSMDLPSGGHLSHGYQTPTKKISAVSSYFETVPYRVDPRSGLINYDQLRETALVYRPGIIVGGFSAYPRHVDWEKLRAIADEVNAVLLADICHISGLVAAQAIPDPFEFADVVTTTTHKSLRGPRGALIFYRKGIKGTDKAGTEIHHDFDNRINASVFPGHQGGPHNHTITALATALRLTQTSSFKAYATQVLKNAQALSNALINTHGHSLVTNGTSNHLVLIDLKPEGVDGARVEYILEKANIATNKNTVPGDKSAMVPGGLRAGTPAMTTRGMNEKDFEWVADVLHRGTVIAQNTAAEMRKGSTTKPKFVEFKKYVDSQMPAGLVELKEEVIDRCRRLETIGQHYR